MEGVFAGDIWSDKLWERQIEDIKILFHLETDIFENPYCYFITTLDPRFDLASSILSKALSKIRGGMWKPIFIRPYPVVNDLKHENIVYFWLGRGGSSNSEVSHPKVIIPEAEDLNVDISRYLNEIFCTNDKLINLVSRLAEKQECVPLFGFTTSFLNIANRKISVIGPRSEITTIYDSKIKQRRIFEDTEVPFPETEICYDVDRLEESEIVRKHKPCIASAEYSSGGGGTVVIRTDKDIPDFRRRLSARYINQRYIVSPFLKAMSSPNSTGFVIDEENVLVISVSDQLLYETRNEIKYEGNCYPSAIPARIQDEIILYTRSIGEELASKGYRGFFGCDFIVTREGETFVVDLNPRKQGGFLCNLLMFEILKPEGCPGLLDLELMQIEQPNPPLSSSELSKLKGTENPRIHFGWAQSKIRPRHKYFRISGEVWEGSEEICFTNIGSRCVKSFFPQGVTFYDGSFLGCVVTTGNSREEALATLSQLESSASRRVEGYDQESGSRG